MKKWLFLTLLIVAGVYANAQTTDADYKTLTGIAYRTEGDAYALERCKADIYCPANTQGFPTVVWFHGGGLTSGEKFIPDQLKRCGLAVVAVNYRLLPRCSSVADCIDDAAVAVAWVFNNIGKYGGDKRRIYVAGHSAGGYLTNMIGLDRKWLKRYGIEADSIAALFPFSGHAVTHKAYREMLGISETQPTIDEFAPLYHVRPDAPPLIIISGDREMEMLGRYEEQAYLWRMMKVAGHTQTFLYEMDGYNHGDMAAPAFHILKEYIKKQNIK